MITIIIPVKTISEANCSEHWTKKRKRYAEQKFITYINCNTQINSSILPCQITLTRIAPRTLDTDNLPVSMKWIRDQIADLIVPGLAPGRADNEPKITWKYDQKKGKKGEYLVRVDITKF